MAKIIEYVDIPDDKVEEFKTLLSKTHGNSAVSYTHLTLPTTHDV
mgnify:CR=1 FL=1